MAQVEEYFPSVCKTQGSVPSSLPSPKELSLVERESAQEEETGVSPQPVVAALCSILPWSLA